MHVEVLDIYIVTEHRKKMEGIYNRIKEETLKGKREVVFRDKETREEEDSDILTDLDWRVLDKDGYSVNWDNYLKEFTISGWLPDKR